MYDCFATFSKNAQLLTTGPPCEKLSFHTYPLADVGERPAEQDEEVEGLVHEALPALLQDPLKGLAMQPLIGVIPLLDGQQVVQGQALRGEGRVEVRRGDAG
jgi:hypothetical protein